jgi:hypothetical protein
VSTNNRWRKLAVKSGNRKSGLGSGSTGSAKDIHGIADSAAQQSAGRGRPRAESLGQVVSCRLPAEELQAFDALCTQPGAKSRSDGVRSSGADDVRLPRVQPGGQRAAGGDPLRAGQARDQREPDRAGREPGTGANGAGAVGNGRGAAPVAADGGEGPDPDHRRASSAGRVPVLRIR